MKCCISNTMDGPYDVHCGMTGTGRKWWKLLRKNKGTDCEARYYKK